MDGTVTREVLNAVLEEFESAYSTLFLSVRMVAKLAKSARAATEDVPAAAAEATQHAGGEPL